MKEKTFISLQKKIILRGATMEKNIAKSDEIIKRFNAIDNTLTLFLPVLCVHTKPSAP